VEDGKDTDAGAKVVGIGRDGTPSSPKGKAAEEAPFG